jgi:ADP-ribosylglycohydrolase
MTEQNKIAGGLFGAALGDAFGAPTEFLTVAEITARWPPAGPLEPAGRPSRVTDDTQMTLAVAEALVTCKSLRAFTPQALEESLRASFVQWLNSPDNDRAPGMTCLSACEKLATGRPWLEATELYSKGCGANMRVAPVALLSSHEIEITERERSGVAQFQAALTHGHPTALAASDLTNMTIRKILRGATPRELPRLLRSYAQGQRLVYHEEWLSELWQRPGEESAAGFIARGWDECLAVLDRLDVALESPPYYSDPCLATGAGWIAEEAWATGLLCFLMYPDEPGKALQHAAVTSGDSDSIASLTGAFCGAYLGIEAWPKDWIERIEYGDQIARLARDLAE